MSMDMNSDLFTRKFFSSINSIVAKIIGSSNIPKNIVGTVSAVYGTYPNQTADILLPNSTNSMLNIQNACIHSLNIGDQVYVEMIYGDLTNPIIKFKKI